MNNRTSFALLAILTAVATLTMSSAYATGHYQEAGTMLPEDAKALAEKMLLEAIPISVWTDKTDYGHNDMIMVIGQVANVASGYPVTVTVVSPLNSIVTIAQLIVAEDGSFETTLNTAGALWKYDGTYIIKVNYGSAEKSNKAKVELTGGVTFKPDYSTPITEKEVQCPTNDISVSGQCIPYSISGGTVTGASINSDDNSIVIRINANNDGTITLNPSDETMGGIFMVLVDGEESDDVEIDGNSVTIMFLAGTEEIEVFGAYVIPEFGTIAAMILAVAIISIIAISAKSRLSIIPRY